jgi:hypothetical protein
VRAAKAAARRARAAARARVVSVNGRVLGRTSGQVTLTFAYRSGRRYRNTLRKTLRLGRTGTFSGLVTVPRAGRWRVRAVYAAGKAGTRPLSRYAYVTV